VPTGIVSAEMTAQRFRGARFLEGRCTECGCGDHEDDAAYCRICGSKLVARSPQAAAAVTPP
jgi:voltage-gated potassium channel